jgi:ribose 5-phosphate isomerase A
VNTTDAHRLTDHGLHGGAKRAAAIAALHFLESGSPIGVGTGSTAEAFIEAFSSLEHPPATAVASSLGTAHLLRAAGVEVAPMPPSGRIALYVDGADEVDPLLRLIKGNGGAHTREKVLAAAADLFVCIVDDSKPVPALIGRVVPVEVLPMARTYVARRLAELGGKVVQRPGFVTDNGNEVLDVHGLDLSDAAGLECRIDCISGVVDCGIFAIRPADVLLVGHADGTVEESRRPVR